MANTCALQIGSHDIASNLITCRPEDRAIGTAHWVQFLVPFEARKQLTNPSQRAHFAFDNQTYQHKSPFLTEDFRQSLLDDLTLSDRDAAAIAS